jgi:hypothetical protein
MIPCVEEFVEDALNNDKNFKCKAGCCLSRERVESEEINYSTDFGTEYGF